MSCTETEAKVEGMVDDIHGHQKEIQQFKSQINDLYNQISTKLQDSHSVVSKEIEGIYKDIESLFNKKSTLEIKVHQLKQEIISTLGI